MPAHITIHIATLQCFRNSCGALIDFLHYPFAHFHMVKPLKDPETIGKIQKINNPQRGERRVSGFKHFWSILDQYIYDIK